MLELNLPYPPSVNAYLKIASRTKRYISPAGVAFRRAVQKAVGTNIEPMAQRLMVSITLYPKDKRKRDIDNSIKLTLDSLQSAGVFLDDNQIDRILVERGPIMVGGGCKVIIMPYEVLGNE